jgi:hypothetical protein
MKAARTSGLVLAAIIAVGLPTHGSIAHAGQVTAISAPADAVGGPHTLSCQSGYRLGLRVRFMSRHDHRARPCGAWRI